MLTLVLPVNSALVELKPCRPRVLCFTEGEVANIRLQARMGRLMGIQMSFCDETGAAAHTLVRPFAGVRAHMSLHITKLGELFHTMTEGANEDLGIASGLLDLSDLN